MSSVKICFVTEVLASIDSLITILKARFHTVPAVKLKAIRNLKQIDRLEELIR